MWQRRLRIGPAEPRAFGVKRLRVVAVPATASLTRNVSGFSLLLFSALAMADCSSLGNEPRAFARDNLQHRLRLERGQALDLTHDLAHFLRGHRHVFR